MKKTVSVLLLVCISFFLCVPAFAKEGHAGASFDVNAKSAVLMEASTGKILYSKNPDEALPPASVTKIMTLLLVMEAIDSGSLKLTDTVSVSENAASMGGSQVYLEPFEEMSAEDLLKSVVVSSANDAALALAEKVGGSEEAFVNIMNERAAELQMKNTHFENVSGLDDDTKNHVTSARDIAIMSRELITKHPLILKYSSIWMDSIRNGEFGLSNTNRLIRFYKGANGLKTGSTSKAGFCISATAKRDGMQLISVIMGSETRDLRNAAASQLLDFGFANYALFQKKGEKTGNIPVTGGCKTEIEAGFSDVSILVKKAGGEITETAEVEKSLKAPVKKGDKVGKVIFKRGDETVGEADVVALEGTEKIGFLGVLTDILKKICLIN